MPESVKRYKWKDKIQVFSEDQNGEWVKFEDYESLLKENLDLKAQLKQLNAGGFWE